MNDMQKYAPNGELNEETIANPLDLPSSSEEPQSNTSVMSGTTAPQSQGSPPTKKSSATKKEDDTNAAADYLQAFAATLEQAKTVQWKYITLADGSEGWALFFPSSKWEHNENTGALALK